MGAHCQIRALGKLRRRCESQAGDYPSEGSTDNEHTLRGMMWADKLLAIK